MNTIIQNIQDKLTLVTGLNYVDEDWGQLDYYSPNFPVKWPCALIDVTGASFDNIGIDKTATPRNRQNSEDAILSITVANLKLTNTSSMSPQPQKDQAWSIWTLIEDIHKELQGFNPEAYAGKLIRKSFARVKRDDGVQEYTIMYSFSLNNV